MPLELIKKILDYNLNYYKVYHIINRIDGYYSYDKFCYCNLKKIICNCYHTYIINEEIYNIEYIYIKSTDFLNLY